VRNRNSGSKHASPRASDAVMQDRWRIKLVTDDGETQVCTQLGQIEEAQIFLNRAKHYKARDEQERNRLAALAADQD